MSSNPAENIRTVHWREGALRLTKSVARAALSDMVRESKLAVKSVQEVSGRFGGRALPEEISIEAEGE